MPFFGFSDIIFNKQPGIGGPLKALEGSVFAGSTLRYPYDVGNYDKGHYMVIYIREQKNSAYAGTSGIVDDSVINQYQQGETFKNIPLPTNPATAYGSEVLGKINSGLGSLNSATGGKISGITGAVSSAATNVVSGVNNLFGSKGTSLVADSSTTASILGNSVKSISNKSFIRKTQLTKDAIALYMPETLLFQHQQSYADASIGKNVLGQAYAVGSTVYEDYVKGNKKPSKEELESIAKSAGLGGAGVLAEGFGDVGRFAFRAATGLAVNPLLELIYTSPAFRTFQFDFMFYPRDEKEALEVQKIIEKLKFHQAPEFSKEGKGLLVPPSEFDIRFYYGGAQNPNIPPIGTCVLTDIQMDYAPNGWTAYEIPGESLPSLGRTGMPVAMKMTLSFKEVTYLTKEDYSTAPSGLSQQTKEMSADWSVAEGVSYGQSEGE